MNTTRRNVHLAAPWMRAGSPGNAKPTRYAIRFVSRLNHDWVSDEPVTFECMTAANVYAAMTLGLAPAEHTVEAV